MPTNDFLRGVATQFVNSGLKKVAGNLPGFNISTGKGNTSDTLPLAPKGNFKNYSFPLDVEAGPGLGNQGHYMMFFINEQQNAKISFGGKSSPLPNIRKKVKNVSKTNDNLDHYTDPNVIGGSDIGYFYNPSDYQSIGMKRAPTIKSNTAISMYMPASVTTGYSAQYTDTEMGFLTKGALDAYDRFAAGNMRGGFQEIGNMNQDLANALTKLALNTASMLPGFAGIKAAAEMRSGVVLSDRMELAFKGIDKRTFNYEFKMVPKSEEEAKEIRSIIHAFKFNMLPEFEGSDVAGRALIVPNTFDIKYMWNGNENFFLHKISTCVLESMNVTYGGDSYKTHAGISGDGAPPIETTISLTFKELDLITREQIEKGH